MSDLIEYAARGAVRANDPFARHGIEHLSPSSIGKFAAAPALFVLEKLLGHKSQVGCAAHRGTASEAGIAHGLLLSGTAVLEDNSDTAALIAVAQSEAMNEFNRLSVFSADPRKDKERDCLPGFVATGLAELLPYGVPAAMQGRVELPVEGLAVPIIGFFDFEFEGVVVDLKTAHQCPSEIKRNHAKQVALYAHCLGGIEGRVCYATPKKVATYRVDNVDEHLKALINGAFAIQRFLSISSDPHELAGLVMPDLDSYFYNDPATRQAAFETFGV